MSRLRWKLSPRETGLAGVCAAPRSSWLTDGVTRYACVSPWTTGLNHYRGWYWVAGWDSSVPRINTCSTPVATIEEAKAAAMAHVKAHISATGVKP